MPNIKHIYPKLNNIYTLRYKYYVTPYFCIFIKSTEKGYNFKNLKTDKYLFKRHLYQYKSKCFIVSSGWSIYDGFYYNDKKYDNLIRKIKIKLLNNIFL